MSMVHVDAKILLDAIDASLAGPQFDAAWDRIVDGSPPDALPDDPFVETLARTLLEHSDRFRPEPTAFPAMATNIVNVASSDSLEVAKLANSIKQDPAVAAHVLRVANSVLYRRARPVSDLGLAVVRIGTREVAQIASGIAAKSLFDVEIKAEFEMFRPLWAGQFRRAMTIAYAASWSALLTGKSRPDRAFLSGMMHDAGKGIALRTFCALMREGTLRDMPTPLQLEAALERVHPLIGAQLMHTFSMPPHLAHVCTHHHDAVVAAGGDNDDIHLVRVLTALLDMRTYSPWQVPVAPLKQSLEALRISKDTVMEIFDELGESAVYVGQIY